jgi:hypothetical protein
MARDAKLLAMSSLADRNARLAAARGDLLALRAAIDEGEPWPLSDNFGTEPEASWGPRETIAHVQEMLPFWQGEIERVLAGQPPVAGSEPAFGRVAADELRLAVIERDRTLPLQELFDRIDAGLERFVRRLGELRDDDLEATGVHPRLGPMTVGQIVDRFVVGHLEEHVDQLREILGRAAGATSGA